MSLRDQIKPDPNQSFDQRYLAIIKTQFPSLKGIRIFEVGCSDNRFIDLAESNGMVVVGLEHNRLILEEAVAEGDLSVSNIPKILIGTFRDTLDLHPELAGSFDIVKITGVSDYMRDNIADVRSIGLVSRGLLKPNGIVLFEAPANYFSVSGMFQANQDPADMVKAAARIQKQLSQFNPANTVKAAKSLQRAGRMFLDVLQAFFREIKQVDHFHYICSKPLRQEEVPEISDIHVNMAQSSVTIKKTKPVQPIAPIIKKAAETPVLFSEKKNPKIQTGRIY